MMLTCRWNEIKLLTSKSENINEQRTLFSNLLALNNRKRVDMPLKFTNQPPYVFWSVNICHFYPSL